MKVLKATQEQYDALNGYTSGVHKLAFAQDNSGNWVIGRRCMGEVAFSGIFHELEELELITFSPKITEGETAPTSYVNQTLPSWVLTDLANPAVSVVSIPHGRYTFGKTTRFAVSRSNITLDGNNSTFVYDSSDNLKAEPFDFYSLLYGTGGRPGGEYSVTALIDASTDRVTLSENCPNVAAGDIVKLRLGVNVLDPAEPEAQRFIKVKQVVGSGAGAVVIFEEPIGRIVAQWTDESLKAATQYEDKVGPRAPTGGNWFRGYGQDHGMSTYTARQPANNFTIKNITLELDETNPAPYSSRMFQFDNCFNVTAENITLINPASTCWRQFASENVTVKGLTILGDGRKDVWDDPENLSPVSVLSFWGGLNCKAFDVVIHCYDAVLLSAEAGTEDTYVERAYIRSPQKLPQVLNRFQFGMHGVHPRCKTKDVSIDVPTATSAFTSSTVGNGLTFHNLRNVSNSLPATLALYRFTFLGTITIGDNVFGPMVTTSKQFILPATTSGQKYTLPIDPGLYRSMRLVFDRRDGCGTVSNLPAFAANPSVLDFTFSTTYFGNIPAGTLRLPAEEDIQISSTGAAFTGTVVTLYYELMPLN